MGIFTAKLRVANTADNSRSQEIDFLVDTGASYSGLSRDRLKELGIAGTGRMQFKTIEGHLIEREVAPVLVSTDGRIGGDTVIVGEAGDMEVIGAHTLESLGVAADPVQKKLVPTIGLAL
jgi:predicted aspartyl protease